MTRRLAIYMLLTVWAMLIAAGLTAYFAVRSILLADLDASLLAKAASLPEVSGKGTPADARDRYLVRTEWGQTLARPVANTSAANRKPKLVSAKFVRLDDGNLLRTVTVRIPPAHPAQAPLTVVYSTPADAVHQVLTRLAGALGACGVIGGAMAAVVAALVARSALRPLNAVADTIGVIDEQRLDRRVDEHSLPEELQPVGQKLNVMLARLEQSFRQRRQFLADASHELRTPVAALVTTLDVTFAKKQQDASVWRRALEACHVTARTLRQIVERLTDEVHAERASASPPKWIDAAPLLDCCATVTESLASAKGITVCRAFEGRWSLRTSPDRLRRALLNLLHNAVAYTPEGGTITLEARIEEADAIIRVCDTGVGIPPEHLPHVFSPFYRVDAARSSDSGHLGLGLFQVRTDVEAIGGVCEIDSEPGAGTRVTIRLPGCARPSAEKAVTDPAGFSQPPSPVGGDAL